MMSKQGKRSQPSSKFFNAFFWSTGISILVLIPLSLLVLDILEVSNSGLTAKVIFLCIIASAVNSIFVGLVAIFLPTNEKIIYIPASIFITSVVSGIIGSLTGSTDYLIPQQQIAMPKQKIRREYSVDQYNYGDQLGSATDAYSSDGFDDQNNYNDGFEAPNDFTDAEESYDFSNEFEEEY